MEKLYIPIVLGTAREGRQSEKVAKFVLEEVQKRPEIEAVFVDVKDHLFGKTGRFIQEKNMEAELWHKIAEKADGFFIIMPEYNHGYPGELKILLDSSARDYAKKPIALCGVSSGGFGGARVIDHIKPVLVEMSAIPLKRSLNFTNVENLFDTEGKILDGSYMKKVSDVFDDLVWYAKVMKEARNMLPLVSTVPAIPTK